MPKMSWRVLFAGLAGAVALATCAPGLAEACSFNTDCQVGSKCHKKPGQLYGVCVGGLSPGNSNDRVPVYAPLDLNGTHGDTCQFNTDCGPGSECVKESLFGTCMKKKQNRPIFSLDKKKRKTALPTLGLGKNKQKTCRFSIDCGVGAKCLKSAGSLVGRCYK